MASLGNDCGPKIPYDTVSDAKWHLSKMTLVKKIGAKECKTKWHFIKLTAAQKIGTKRCKTKWHFLKTDCDPKNRSKKVQDKIALPKTESNYFFLGAIFIS